MVNLEIDFEGSKYWFLDPNEFGNSYSSGPYCRQYTDGEQFFFVDGGPNRLLGCNSKEEYIKLLKLKVLW